MFKQFVQSMYVFVFLLFVVENIVKNVSIDLEMLEEPLFHITCRENIVQPNNFSIVVNYTSGTKTKVLVMDYNTSVDIKLGPVLSSTVYAYTVSVVDGISGSVIGWTVQGNFTTPGIYVNKPCIVCVA